MCADVFRASLCLNKVSQYLSFFYRLLNFTSMENRDIKNICKVRKDFDNKIKIAAYILKGGGGRYISINNQKN